MHYGFDTKTVVIAQGQSVTNAATLTTGLIDTLGYYDVSIDVVTGTAAVTNLPTVLKLQESDITTTTGFGDVVAFTGGTAVDSTHGFVIPAPSLTTATTGYVRFDVDCRARKRYLRLLFSPVATQIVDVHARLARPAQSVSSAATAGMAGALISG